MPLLAGSRPADAINTRQRILEAAASLLRERGYHATTTRAISKIVGMLSGSLFHYFDSKPQILFEVMHQAATSLCQRADAVAAASSSPLEQLRGLIRLQLHSLIDDETRDFYAVLIGEWRELDPEAKAALMVFRTRYTAVWHQALEACAARGLLRGDAHTLQLVLHGAINWASTWFKPDGRMSLDEYAAVLERLVLEAPGSGAAVPESHAVLV